MEEPNTTQRKHETLDGWWPANLRNRTSATPKFFEVSFEENLKRQVNPFDMERIIAERTGIKPKQVFSVNNRSFIAELDNLDDISRMLSLDKVKDVPCNVTTYDPFNTSKGIIYIQEFDLSTAAAFDDFKIGLKEMHDIKDASLAPFIRARTPDTYAVMITFNTPNMPYSIYIPGERYDCRIYPFYRKPMLCNNCQKYGHTSKRCRDTEPTCRICCQSHQTESCISSVTKCFHCQGNHRAGDRECPHHIRETALLRTQEDKKVSLQRARQMLSGSAPEFIPSHPPSNHFDITFTEKDKRTFSPWAIESCLNQAIKGKPKTIRSKNKTTFTIEISTSKQREQIQKTVNIGGFPVTIRETTHSTSPRGIIYIYEYAVTDFQSFRQGLMERLPISDASLAPWRKSRSPRATPLLLTFRGDIPRYVNIPGEQALTHVYELQPRPMMCRNCQDFGHTAKHCRGIQTCKKCSDQNHSIDNCTSKTLKCYHCCGPHMTGSGNCPEYRYEVEIFTIQTNSRIPRGQAKLQFDREHPNFRISNYKEATIRTMPQDNHQNPISSAVNKTTSSTAGAFESKKTTPVICMSPASGRQYVEHINIDTNLISPTTSQEVFIDDTTATREIFDAHSKTHREQHDNNTSDSLDDIHHYEEDLRNSRQKGKNEKGKNEKGKNEKNKNETNRNEKNRNENNTKPPSSLNTGERRKRSGNSSSPKHQSRDRSLKRPKS